MLCRVRDPAPSVVVHHGDTSSANVLAIQASANSGRSRPIAATKARSAAALNLGSRRHPYRTRTGPVDRAARLSVATVESEGCAEALAEAGGNRTHRCRCQP